MFCNPLQPYRNAKLSCPMNHTITVPSSLHSMTNLHFVNRNIDSVVLDCVMIVKYLSATKEKYIKAIVKFKI